MHEDEVYIRWYYNYDSLILMQRVIINDSQTINQLMFSAQLSGFLCQQLRIIERSSGSVFCLQRSAFNDKSVKSPALIKKKKKK